MIGVDSQFEFLQPRFALLQRGFSIGNIVLLRCSLVGRGIGGFGFAAGSLFAEVFLFVQNFRVRTQLNAAPVFGQLRKRLVKLAAFFLERGGNSA